MPDPRYQVLAPLMSGEGSRAFLGLRILDDAQPRPAVLVWLPEGFAEDPEALHQLRRETLRASLLEHPHITRVFGLPELEEGLARAVEYADGETLRSILRETGGKLSPLIAARVLADAASGIHYAHLAGNDDGTPLFHGDVRPETVMLSYEGVTKVAGYGALAVAPREANGRRVIGRRRYSAPEQVLGGRNAIDKQSDVFLLGVTLYECLTGHVPFSETSDMDRAIIHSPLPRMRGDVVTESLNDVVQKATAKKASQRHPTALAFREHISQVVQGLPSHDAVASYLMNFFVDERPARSLRRDILDQAIDAFRREQDVTSRIRMPAPVAVAEVTPPAVAIGKLTPARRPVPVPPPAAVETPLLSPTQDPAPEPREEVTIRSRRPAPPRPVPGVALPPGPVSRPANDDLDDEDERPQERPASLMWMVASVLVGAAVGWYLMRDPEPKRHASAETAEEEMLTPTMDSPTGMPTPVADPAPLVEAAGRRMTDGVQLVVTPPVDVFLGKVKQGRTPLALKLPPGTHLLKFVDEKQGVSVFKNVTVGPGPNEPVRIELAEGMVDLDVPGGADIFVNGRHYGDYSLEKEPMFEGWQHVVVKWKSQRWEKTFQLRPNENVTLKAEFVEPPLTARDSR